MLHGSTLASILFLPRTSVILRPFRSLFPPVPHLNPLSTQYRNNLRTFRPLRLRFSLNRSDLTPYSPPALLCPFALFSVPSSNLSTSPYLAASATLYLLSFALHGSTLPAPSSFSPVLQSSYGLSVLFFLRLSLSYSSFSPTHLTVYSCRFRSPLHFSSHLYPLLLCTSTFFTHPTCQQSSPLSALFSSLFPSYLSQPYTFTLFLCSPLHPSHLNNLRSPLYFSSHIYPSLLRIFTRFTHLACQQSSHPCLLSFFTFHFHFSFLSVSPPHSVSRFQLLFPITSFLFSSTLHYFVIDIAP